jgi:pimeloyl-ACP methyl ester carboxylesterase
VISSAFAAPVRAPTGRDHEGVRRKGGREWARLYWESFRGRRPAEVTIPTGFAVYPAEIVPPVRTWVERTFHDVRHWAEYDRGGHFAAFEVPGTFVADLRTCFREHRTA